MEKWDYQVWRRCDLIAIAKISSSDSEQKLQEALQELGSECWELFFIRIADLIDQDLFIFKRKISK